MISLSGCGGGGAASALAASAAGTTARKNKLFHCWLLLITLIHWSGARPTLGSPKSFNVCLREETVPAYLKKEDILFFLDVVYEMYRIPTKLNYVSTCNPPFHSRVHMYISFEDSNHEYHHDSIRKHCQFQKTNIAHAFYPPDFDIHINNNKLFTTMFDSDIGNKGLEYGLLKVLLHEFGHSMGLRHSLDIDSIMNTRPFENFAININDIYKLKHIWLQQSSMVL